MRLCQLIIFKVFLQCSIILAPIIIALVWPVQDLFLGILSYCFDPAYLETGLISITKNEKSISIILGIIISTLILLAIRRKNRNRLFNTGNGYFNYDLWFYWVAARVLGYGKLTLIRVPIYLQYKLLFKDWFQEILTDNDIETLPETPIVIEKNINGNGNEINFILSDTYETKIEELPLDKRSLPTVMIQRASEFNGVRTYNPKFISIIREKTNYYRMQYTCVNIYATTNTNHNKDIILKCFKNGNRTGFKQIYVYEQGNSGRKYYFFKKHLIK